MRVIISAAGTGGHINPGIAIANKIKKEQPESQIIFIGTNRGLENDLVPRAGYELKTIDAYGFDRKISLDNIKRTYKTYRSIGEAKKIIEEFPKRKNGQFHKRTITLAKSCNAIPDKERGFGYIHGQIVAKYKANRKLEVKYIKSYSVV